MFPPNIALSILKIKILIMAQPDKLIWAHEKNVTLSVKSTYHMIYEDRQQLFSKSSSTEN